MSNRKTVLKVTATKQFKRDAKKQFNELLTPEWAEVLYCLANGLALPSQYRDHALTNNWKGFRDCHIKPDLVLIYAKEDNVVQLVRLASHSEIFG